MKKALVLSQRVIGLTSKFIPFVAMVIILLWTNTMIRDFVIWVGSLQDALILLIAFGAGLIIFAEGWTQKKSEEFGTIVGASLLWFVGAVLMFTGIAQFIGLIDIVNGTGDLYVVFSVFWILATFMLGVMAIYEVVISGKWIVTAPHRPEIRD